VLPIRNTIPTNRRLNPYEQHATSGNRRAEGTGDTGFSGPPFPAGTDAKLPVRADSPIAISDKLPVVGFSDNCVPSRTAVVLRKARRPPGPRMPCGWCCGSEFGCTAMRRHFTECRNRPKRRDWIRRAQCTCCRSEYNPRRMHQPICAIGVALGECWRCRSRYTLPEVDSGRPSRPATEKNEGYA
jgi:hypothetical protein